ncbi:FK506 binding protein [Aureococcus anophagefferens]|nr:FK506 binding protein [Aureococcus anophagefferens]
MSEAVAMSSYDNDEPIVEDVTAKNFEGIDAADWHRKRDEDADAAAFGDDELDAEGYRVLMPGVRYKEVRKGTGPQAEYKQAVICTWTGALTETGEVFETCKRKMLRVGGGRAAGLELALRQQQDGTKCVCKAEWRFAYGDVGRPASDDEKTKSVPPNSAVTWTIETHRLWYKECDDTMTPGEMLYDARNKKVLGNEHFHHENWKKAGANYQEVLKGLNVWNYEEGDPDRIEAEEIYIHCGNNLVYALMKMDEWLKAEKAVCDVLTVAPGDKKSAPRGAGRHAPVKWPEADAALKIAMETWPNHKQFRDLYETLREHKRKYRERKAKMSAKMSKNLFNSAPKPKPAEDDESDSNSDSDSDAEDAPAAAPAAAAPPARARGAGRGGAARSCRGLVLVLARKGAFFTTARDCLGMGATR